MQEIVSAIALKTSIQGGLYKSTKNVHEPNNVDFAKGTTTLIELLIMTMKKKFLTDCLIMCHLVKKIPLRVIKASLGKRTRRLKRLVASYQTESHI